MKKAIIIALLALLLLASPAYADMAAPDSTPTIEQIDVYRNLLETGDKLYLIYANIPYVTTPDITMPNAFVWRLMGTDNTTVLGSTTGYAFNEKGYGYNVFGMYFAASENVTWGTAYTLRLSGNPSVFASPPQYNYPVSVTDYTSLTSSADNKAALAARILTIASSLDTQWGLATAYSLIFESESGTALSIYGEATFRGAIYGVQALAPTAFRMIITDIDADDRAWNLNYSGNLSQMYTGTWIEPAKTGGGTIFGVGYDLMSIILSMVCAAILVLANVTISHDVWNGYIDLSILLIALPHIDLIPLSFTALVCAIFVMYEGTKVKSFVG